MADTFKVSCSETKKICYAADGAGVLGYTDWHLRQLQAEINRFAIRGGFRPVEVNGFIGDDTAAAMRMVAALGEGADYSKYFVPDSFTRTLATDTPLYQNALDEHNKKMQARWTRFKSADRAMVAKEARGLLRPVNGLGDLLSLSPAAIITRPTTPSPKPKTPSSTPKTPSPPPSNAALPTDLFPGQDAAGGDDKKKSVRWPYYVAGGVGALALIYAVYAFIVPPKAARKVAPQAAPRVAPQAVPQAVPQAALPAPATAPVAGSRYRSRHAGSRRKRSAGFRR